MSRYLSPLAGALLVAACAGGAATTTAVDTTHGTVSTTQHVDTTTLPHGHDSTTLPPVGTGQPWTMFRRDPQHTAVVPGVGNIDPAAGPVQHWSYRVSEASRSMRWFSTFPLGDLDGDGDLEVVVTTADGMPGVPPTVIALTAEGDTATPLWSYPVPNAESGIDQYGPALVDANGNGLPDVVFSSRDGFERALDGRTGELIWQYDIGRIMESGPMIADLDGDGAPEVIQVTDCVIGGACDTKSGALLVFAADPTGNGTDNPPLWQVELPWKADSGEPLIADFDPADGRDLSQIVWGGWGGRLMVIWRDPGGEVRQGGLVLATLDDAVSDDSDKVVMRTSPMVADVGDGLTVFFGWMPDHDNYRDARQSAVSIRVSTVDGTVEFTPRWTVVEDAWKSSPSLLELADRTLVVTGTGYALGPTPERACEDVAGRYVARDALTGEIAWTISMADGQGDLRGSTAVADIDSDGQPEVIAGVGCGGQLLGIDGATGAIEWQRQLGTNTYGSPSLADLDGDGSLEIVVSSLDGYVYAFGG